MALTLANMLARVKRLVPTTQLDTELQDALLERMNFIATLDTFPFQEKYQYATLTAGDYVMSTPDNFAVCKDVSIWTADYQQSVEIMDACTFTELYPNPAENTTDTISACTIKVAEGVLWFNSIASVDHTIRMFFLAIPDDATDATISQMTELAKLTVVKWAAADGFRMISQFDRAMAEEQDGNNFLTALKRRYQLSREEDARFISAKEVLARRGT